ncbi:MAG: NUDIX domain-containing protein [Lachnospiraceae bacterium]|nr:NUDIX domain-containing protein [Lachnospiraceae bacterium]
MEVRFYESVADELLEFAVIVARAEGKWVFCKHRERDTYEVPGGHREEGETIFEAACRELYEETGALEYDIEPVAVYSVLDGPKGKSETFGMLFFAEITAFEEELHSEIERIILTGEPVDTWTYPLIQPLLMKRVELWLRGSENRFTL